MRGFAAAGLAAAAAAVAVAAGGGSASATYPGPNGKITYYSTRSGDAEVIVSGANGEGQHGFDPPALGYFPSFSPNAKKIAYQSQGQSRIVVMRADGTNRREITPEGSFAGDPAFGRRWIVFRLAVGLEEDLYKIRPDGTGMRELTDRPGDEFAASFSPDGRRVVYAAGNLGLTDLFVVNVRTGRGHRLTRTDGVYENEPSWSPNGKRIAFSRYKDGVNDIAIMRADGTHRRLLTDDPIFQAFPAFSPNGKRIAFSRGGPEEIVVMDVDGGNRRVITNNDGQDVGPDWGVGRR
jgi:TolB protein